MGVANLDDDLALDAGNHHLPPRPVYLDDDDEDEAVTYKKPSRKRKRASDEEEEDDCGAGKNKGKKSKRGEKSSSKGKGRDDGEKRLGRFRAQPPQAHKTLLDRALNQRMFVIERNREQTTDGPIEVVTIAGSTGNLYTVKVDKKPSCDCPYALKGNECKHVVYALVRTLKAPAHLQYQRALLSTELKEIFDKAPPIPTEKGEEEKDDNGIRKPIEDDCPICCVEFEEGDSILYCRAACGNNVHKTCFEQWAVQKRAMGGGVTCPFCRTPWEGETEKPGMVDKTLGVNKEGYVNVASQLGISGMRDTSTYHQFWVRRERKQGGLRDEDPDTALYSEWESRRRGL